MSIKRTLQKEEWQNYFDLISKTLNGKEIEIEIISDELGDEIIGKSYKILGLTYDSKDDAFEVGLEEVEHIIRSPVEISICEEGLNLRSVEVQQEDGTKQILTLREPLALA